MADPSTFASDVPAKHRPFPACPVHLQTARRELTSSLLISVRSLKIIPETDTALIINPLLAMHPVEY
jgi:hypothetical protein